MDQPIIVLLSILIQLLLNVDGSKVKDRFDWNRLKHVQLRTMLPTVSVIINR